MQLVKQSGRPIPAIHQKQMRRCCPFIHLLGNRIGQHVALRVRTGGRLACQAGPDQCAVQHLRVQSPLALVQLSQPSDHLRQCGQDRSINGDQALHQLTGDLSGALIRQAPPQMLLVVQPGAQRVDQPFEQVRIKHRGRFGERPQRHP